MFINDLLKNICQLYKTSNFPDTWITSYFDGKEEILVINKVMNVRIYKSSIILDRVNKLYTISGNYRQVFSFTLDDFVSGSLSIELIYLMLVRVIYNIDDFECPDELKPYLIGDLN